MLKKQKYQKKFAEAEKLCQEIVVRRRASSFDVCCMCISYNKLQKYYETTTYSAHIVNYNIRKSFDNNTYMRKLL